MLESFLESVEWWWILMEMASEFHICGAVMENVWFEDVWRLRIVLC